MNEVRRPRGFVQTMNEVAADLVAGSIAGSVGCFIGHPLDTIKVRMQGRARISAPEVCRRILVLEGPGGFFKGVTPPLISIGIYQSVAFASFSLALAALTSKPEATASVSDLYIAGCVSGLATVFVTTPMDLVKIRLQNQVSAGEAGRYRGFIHCVQSVVSTEGPQGLYR